MIDAIRNEWRLLRDAWQAGDTPRDPWFYISGHFITPQEYLLLVSLPEPCTEPYSEGKSC
jgi:hypothetical protein